MKFNHSFLLIVSTLIFTLAGCKTLDQSDFVRVDPAPESVSPVFSYEPTGNNPNTDISIGVVGAQYSTDVQLSSSLDNQISTLSKELQNAFSVGIQRELVAKGFSISGEFPNTNLMTFPQKDQSTMVIVPKINLSIVPETSDPRPVYWRSTYNSGEPQQLPLKVYYGEVLMGGNKYEQKGRFLIRSSIHLQLIEPLTNQILWVKDIPVEQNSNNWTWYYWTREVTNDQGEVIQVKKYPVKGYDGREAALTSLFTTIYDTIMKKISDYMSREEIVQLKEDAEKLKDRWRAGNGR